MAVGVPAALAGQSELAGVNVVRSNAFKVLFNQGISALNIPLRVEQKPIQFDVALMIGLSGLVIALGWTGRTGWLEGLLFSGLLASTVWAVIESRRERVQVNRVFH